MSEYTGLPGDDSGDKRQGIQYIPINRYTDEDRQQVTELYRSGRSKHEVSRILDIPISTVKYWLKSTPFVDVINQVLPDENLNGLNADGGVIEIIDGANGVIGSVNHKDNLTMNRHVETNGGAYSANVEVSAAGSSSGKRKRESAQSQEAGGKRKRSEVAESFPSWQPTTNLQAVNAMMPSSLYQQQATVNQDVVNPTAVPAVSFLQQPTPMIVGLPLGFQQSMMQNMYDPNSNSFQMAYLQQYMLASQMQQQQQQQQLLQLQQLQQQTQLQQHQQTQQKQSQKKSRQQHRQQQQYQQNQQQQQQYQQNQLQQLQQYPQNQQQYQQNQQQHKQNQPNQPQQQQCRQNQQQQQSQQNQQEQQQCEQNQQQQKQNQPNQPQQQQCRQNQQHQHSQQNQQKQQQCQQNQQQQKQNHEPIHPQEQQPTVNYFNSQLQHMAASTISTDVSQFSPTMLSAAITSPRSSGKGNKRAPTALSESSTRQECIKGSQDQLKQVMLQNASFQQQINVPASLEITSVASSQNAALTPQDPYTLSSLQNPALSLQNHASARTKSRSDTGSPLPSALSPIASSSSPLHRGQSPLCRVLSPLSGLLTPPPSSTPNPFWQLQFQQRQCDQETIPDSAYQSQDSQSSSVPSSRRRPRPRHQLEYVDGYKCDDFDIGEVADFAVLNVPPSIMNPLNIRSKRIKKKVNELAVCNNKVPKDEPVDLRSDLINGRDRTAGVPKTEPVNDLPNWLKNDSEQIAEETVASPRLKEYCNESNALDYGKIQRTYSFISRGISLEEKENEMNVHPVGGSKRGKRKGKNNGKRAIKKKHSKKTLTVKKEYVTLEPVDIEFVKEELQPIKEEYDTSQSLEVECQMQTIVFADNQKKRKRTLDLDSSNNVLKSRFQPNQMVSLAADWLSHFDGDTWMNPLYRQSEPKTT